MWDLAEPDLHATAAAGAEHQVVPVGHRIRVIAVATAARARRVGVHGGGRDQVVEADETIDVGSHPALALLRADAAIEQEDAGSRRTPASM